MFIPESRVPLSLRIHLGATPGHLYLNDAMLPYHHIAMYLLRDNWWIARVVPPRT